MLNVKFQKGNHAEQYDEFENILLEFGLDVEYKPMHPHSREYFKVKASNENELAAALRAFGFTVVEKE